MPLSSIWGLKTRDDAVDISQLKMTFTPFYPQIKIRGVQIKIKGLQIKITGYQIKIRGHQIKIKWLQIKIRRLQIKIKGNEVKTYLRNDAFCYSSHQRLLPHAQLFKRQDVSIHICFIPSSEKTALNLQLSSKVRKWIENTCQHAPVG